MENPCNELEHAQAEVYLKLGKMMLLFQEQEIMIRFIISSSFPETPLSRLPDQLSRSLRMLAKLPLGQLKDRWLTQLTHGQISSQLKLEVITEIEISIQLGLTISVETIDDKIAKILAVRNYVAHQFRADINLKTIDGCVSAKEILDTKWREVFDSCEFIRQVFVEVRDYMECVLKEVNSDEFAQQLQSAKTNGRC